MSLKTAKLESVREFTVRRIKDGTQERILDAVAVEEPLAIHLTYWQKGRRVTESLALTMRTPGHDFELATGYLFSEGVIRSREDIVDLHTIGSGDTGEVAVEVAPAIDIDSWRLTRNGLIASACGICGKRMLDALPEATMQSPDDIFQVEARLLQQLPDLLHRGQKGFAQTGGLHAAALMSKAGTVISDFEDIGRHNALDKLIGNEILQKRAPLQCHVVFMSSRGSYELVQKAAAAGAPILATVGGPSSLAIEAARRWGLTLIGFVRDRRFNIYSGDWRVKL